MRARCWVWLAVGLAGCGGCDEEAGGLDVPSGLDAGDSGSFDLGARDVGGIDLGTNDTGMDASILDVDRFDVLLVDAFVVDAASSDGGVRGTCTTSADCGGRACLVVQDDPNGWHTCELAIEPEATSCPTPNEDFCCSSADCAFAQSGACRRGPFWYCGGAAPTLHNECLYDECSTDTDCGSLAGTCVPRGAFGELNNVCSLGGCRFDDECTSRAGGRCIPFFWPCTSRLTGFFCAYADSPCDDDQDCSGLIGGYCDPGIDGQTECREFIPPP